MTTLGLYTVALIHVMVLEQEKACILHIRSLQKPFLRTRTDPAPRTLSIQLWWKVPIERRLLVEASTSEKSAAAHLARLRGLERKPLNSSFLEETSRVPASDVAQRGKKKPSTE